MTYYEKYISEQLDRVKLNIPHTEYCDRFYGGCLGKRYITFKQIFEYLNEIDDPLVVETGISRIVNNYCGDGNSTLIFDEYLNFFKKSGKLITIDIDKSKCDYTAPLLSERSTVICSDSVVALHGLSIDYTFPKIDFLYLDSYDVDWDNPHPSALHHFKELLAVFSKLKPGTLIVVDDHDNGRGKGKYIAEYMNNINKIPYFDEYQIGWIW